MASTFSPNLRIELIGAGEQSGAWNNTTNTNLGSLIEQAISGVQDITLAGSDYTLEAANGTEDEARNMVLVLKGTPGASRNVIAPDVDKIYIVRNETANSHTIKTASGSGVSVPAGSSAIVFCDATGNGTFYNAVDDLDANATIGGVPIVTTTGTQTLSGKTLTAPRFADGGFIADANGNEIVVLDTVASAVNEITVANAATGASPSISATGSNSDIDLLLVPKGTGAVKAGGVEVATTSGTQSLSNKTLVSPANVSATTGNAAIVAATGPDANININLTPKGTGTVNATTVASFTAGSALAPSITPSGDLNTGIWFPAADTISFATNGTEDFRLGPAGQLGIAGANYGTASQIFRSGGPSAAPSWSFMGGISFATTTGAAITASTGVTVSRLGAGSYLITHNIGSTSYIPVISAHLPLIGNTGLAEGIPRPVSGQYVVSSVGANSFRIDTYVREFEQTGDDNVNTFVTEAAYEWTGTVYVAIMGV